MSTISETADIKVLTGLDPGAISRVNVLTGQRIVAVQIRQVGVKVSRGDCGQLLPAIETKSLIYFVLAGKSRRAGTGQGSRGEEFGELRNLAGEKAGW